MADVTYAFCDIFIVSPWVAGKLFTEMIGAV